MRPATVCGYAKRQRLDLVVNILTNHAYHNREIRVFGGDQLRPNLHVQDYSDACITVVEAPANKVRKQIFNCGNEKKNVKIC